MSAGDWIVTGMVLIGMFFLSYSSIRQQGLLDTVKEIRDIIKGKYDDVKDATEGMKYQN